VQDQTTYLQIQLLMKEKTIKMKQNKTEAPITPKDPTPLEFIRIGEDPDPHTKARGMLKT
jgi:hypothetical protein